MTDTRITKELIKSKKIKLLIKSDRIYAYIATNKENTEDNQVFTDGVWYFHLNKYSMHCVQKISLSWKAKWEKIRG